MAMDLDEALIKLEAAQTGSELIQALDEITAEAEACLLYTSPSPRD